MKPGKVVALVVGILLVIPGIAMLLGGTGLTIAYGVARDDDGFFDFDLDRLQTPTPAIVSGEIDFFSEPGDPDWVIDVLDLDLRVTAGSVDDGELFVGIGPSADVTAYLDGVARDEITDLDGGAPEYRRTSGDRLPDAPDTQSFWAEQASGIDPVLDWEADEGDWTIVLMNADGSAGVSADVEIGAKSGLVLAVAIGMIVGGVLMLGLGVFLIIVAFRRRDAAPVDEPPHETVAGGDELVTTTEHPVALSARIDPDLSRWMWLVKWILAIPHFIVLAFLWLAVVVTTIIAGIAILFTGRYPSGLFGFNRGVLRWSWRVAYYCHSGGLGTDRYPPFSLDREPDYPAVLDIAEPGELSRWQVLVKWWLLAIPHYAVIALLLGGAPMGMDDVDGPWYGGLLSLLVLIAAVILLVTGRYPRSLFDLIVGFNRWIARVGAYVLLMTDRYPPFRLDQGPDEPRWGAPLPPPSAGDTPAPSDGPAATTPADE